MKDRIVPLIRMRGCITLSAVAGTLLLALAVLIIFGPLAGLLFELARFFGAGGGGSALAGLLTGRRLVLLIQSVGLAAAVTAAGICAGVLIATALWRRSRAFSFGILLLVLALSLIPPYIHALTWSSAITLFNQGLTTIGAAPLPSSGWLVSFWVQFMAMFPLAIFLSCIGFASVDRTLVEVARTVRPDSEVLQKIVLPLAAPSLVAAFGFLFVLSCTDYSVPSLFGSDTYALDIFSVYSATGSAGAALITALPLLIITVAVLVACRSGIRRLAQTPNWTVGAWDNPPVVPGPVRLFQEGAFLLLGLQVVVVFSGLVYATGSWAKLSSALAFSAHEIGDSLLIVACVIAIGIPLAIVISRELLLPGVRGSLWWGLILLPVAVPAPLIGIGIISLWNNPAMPVLYGTFLMPAFASLSRFAAFAAIILYVQIRAIDPALIDAARVFSRDTVATLTKVTLPLLAPGIFIASAVLAALTLGELGATLIVTPPGFGTLAIKIYNYLHYGAAAEVAGLCLFMVAATLVAGVCVAGAVAWWNVRGPGSRCKKSVMDHD